MSFTYDKVHDSAAAAISDVHQEGSQIPMAARTFVENALQHLKHGGARVQIVGHLHSVNSSGEGCSDLHIQVTPSALVPGGGVDPPVDPQKVDPPLRTDGPTFEQWTQRGYDPAAYPPKGYVELPSEGLTKYRTEIAAVKNTQEKNAGNQQANNT